MKQISNTVFCDDFILELNLSTRLMPNQYYDYPYLLIENFLPEFSCNIIADHAFNNSDAQRAKVKTTILNSIVDASVDESIRKTVIHKLPKRLLKDYNKSFKKHQRQIEDYFNIALTTATKVQVLEYTKGAFYIKHADDSNELIDEAGETVGFVQVAAQRKISTVLFTTSYTHEQSDDKSFKGGELVFNYLFDEEGKNITIYPKAGDMLVFPSNPIYSHEVMPVQDGYRLTLVQWHNGIIS
jgi:SM-20-related protein